MGPGVGAIPYWQCSCTDDACSHPSNRRPAVLSLHQLKGVKLQATVETDEDTGTSFIRGLKRLYVDDMARVARPILSRARSEYCLLLAANDRWNLCLETPRLNGDLVIGKEEILLTKLVPL
jgi:hypothetical protein